MDRVFKRKIYDKLLDWKNNEKGATALLIEGARRVGKSTIVEEFARREYASYMLIDFAFASEAVKKLFDDVSNLDMLFTKLQFEYDVNLVKGNSLVVFDEIQKCPRARQAIKRLVKDGRYHYIETGSLLGIKMKKNKPRNGEDKILIPSEEHRVYMHPMDYEEFQWALGNTSMIPLLKEAYNNFSQLGDSINRKLMRDFRLYMLVGGMPQAVNAYLDTQNLSFVDQVKRNIIDLYLDDFMEMDPSGYTSKLFKAIPAQLSSNANRYMVGSVIEGGRAERLQRPLSILSESMTTNVAYHSNDPNAGFALHQNLNQFKLFCLDTGLFITLAFKDSDFTSNVIYSKLLGDKLSANLGYVYENVIAQILVASGRSLYYHTWAKEDGRNYEIDFMITEESKITPIEVKSSQSNEHKSIDAFYERFSDRIHRRILLNTKDLHKDKDLICLPVYLAPML